MKNGHTCHKLCTTKQSPARYSQLLLAHSHVLNHSGLHCTRTTFKRILLLKKKKKNPQKVLFSTLNPWQHKAKGLCSSCVIDERYVCNKYFLPSVEHLCAHLSNRGFACDATVHIGYRSQSACTWFITHTLTVMPIQHVHLFLLMTATVNKLWRKTTWQGN